MRYISGAFDESLQGADDIRTITDLRLPRRIGEFVPSRALCMLRRMGNLTPHYPRSNGHVGVVVKTVKELVTKLAHFVD
jgi:hypothetical protein